MISWSGIEEYSHMDLLRNATGEDNIEMVYSHNHVLFAQLMRIFLFNAFGTFVAFGRLCHHRNRTRRGFIFRIQEPPTHGAARGGPLLRRDRPRRRR